MARVAVRGHTLLELLVVLAILAVAVGFAVPALRGGAGPEVDAAARTFAAGLRSARHQALAEGRARALELDIGGPSFRLAGESRRRALPMGVELSLYTARSEIVADGVGAIRFFPDGSSTGGRVTLARGERVRRVDVDWFTGRVRILGEGEALEER
jgi:general secretion pathway protein H